MSCKFNDGFVDCAGREVWMRLPNDGSPAAAREIDSADVHSFNRTKVKPLEIVYIYPIGKFTDDSAGTLKSLAPALVNLSNLPASLSCKVVKAAVYSVMFRAYVLMASLI